MGIATFQVMRKGAPIFALVTLNKVEKVPDKAISPCMLCGLFDWFVWRKQNAYDFRGRCQQEARGKLQAPR